MPNAPRLSHHMLEKYRKLYTNIWSALPHIPQIKKIIMHLELDPVKLNWQLWTDYLGNLLVYKDRTLKVKKISQKIKPRDIYYKAPLKKILSVTELIIFKFDGPKTIAWLLCNDKKIRVLSFYNYSLSTPNTPPLLEEFYPLILLFKYKNMVHDYICKQKTYHVSHFPPKTENEYINKLMNTFNNAKRN